MSDPIEERLARIESSLQELDTVKVVGHLAHIHQALITMCDTLAMLAYPLVVYDPSSPEGAALVDYVRRGGKIEPGAMIPCNDPVAMRKALNALRPSDELHAAYSHYCQARDRDEASACLAYEHLKKTLLEDLVQKWPPQNPPPPTITPAPPSDPAAPESAIKGENAGENAKPRPSCPCGAKWSELESKVNFETGTNHFRCMKCGRRAAITYTDAFWANDVEGLLSERLSHAS